MSLNLQRTAWAVMLGAFLLFCALCFITVYGGYLFLFQSTVPMTTIAQASRGSIGIMGLDLREDVERGSRLLPLGSIVRSNDMESQGVMVVRDAYVDGQFIASMTLMGDAAASLRTAVRPRFEWAGLPYTIEVTRATGRIEVLVADNLLRKLEFVLITDQRARILLTESGRYLIDIGSSSISVESNGGTALIYGPDKTFGYSITSGSGSIYSISNDDLRAQPPVDELLVNSDFNDYTIATSLSDIISVPIGWACSHTVNPPRDLFTVEPSDGRNTFRMSRGNEATTSGETGCTQGLAPGSAWQDISNYDYLAFTASIYIDYQSLGGCGVKGSECPLMVRINYINENGNRGEIVYGFYAMQAQPDQRYPVTCESCTIPHVRIQEKTWYVFESGNILAGFTPDSRPVAISRVRFYSSGHEYEVRVGHIELVAN